MSHAQTPEFVVSRLIENFQADHPEYGRLDTAPLRDHLVGVFRAVLVGNYTAKSEASLADESRACGITRNHYLDLVNLSAHAATNRPRES